MRPTEAAKAVVEGLDKRFLVDTLVELAKVPTAVPLGREVFMEPDDPKLVHYVQNVIRPKIQSLSIYDMIDVPKNQLVVRFGQGSSDASLLVMVYTPTQHHNLMECSALGNDGDRKINETEVKSATVFFKFVHSL